MDDKSINLLATRFGDVTTAADIDSIIYWSELVRGSQQRLADILVKYNNEIDNPVLADLQLENQEEQFTNCQQVHESANAPEKRAGDRNLLAFDTYRNKRNKTRRS